MVTVGHTDTFTPLRTRLARLSINSLLLNSTIDSGVPKSMGSIAPQAKPNIADHTVSRVMTCSVGQTTNAIHPNHQPLRSMVMSRSTLDSHRATTTSPRGPIPHPSLKRVREVHHTVCGESFERSPWMCPGATAQLVHQVSYSRPVSGKRARHGRTSPLGFCSKTNNPSSLPHSSKSSCDG
jgi:hypothetical protein